MGMKMSFSFFVRTLWLCAFVVKAFAPGPAQWSPGISPQRAQSAQRTHKDSIFVPHEKRTGDSQRASIINTENGEEPAKILSAKYLFREQSQQLPGDNGGRKEKAQPGPIAQNRIGAGFAKLAKGAGLKILSRRSSRVRIPYPASKHIDFSVLTPIGI